jgi:hypothetical protein
MSEAPMCHYCSGSNRYRAYPSIVCSGCRRASESFDIRMSMMRLDELNAELKHQEEVKKVFDKLKETL